MTDMKWFAVRCCCDPGKVLGFLRLPTSYGSGQTFFLPRRVAWASDALTKITHDNSHPSSMLERVECHTRIMKSWNNGTNEIAIPSGDKPVEFWRDVEGFVETRQ